MKMDIETLTWLLCMAKRTCGELESENKTLREHNKRFKESLINIKNQTNPPHDTTFHNVKIAVGWCDDLLKPEQE